MTRALALVALGLGPPMLVCLCSYLYIFSDIEREREMNSILLIAPKLMQKKESQAGRRV